MGKKLLVTTMPFEFTPEQISESIEQNSGKLVVQGILQKASEQNQNGRVYELSKDFDGIHPTFRQVPPKELYFSIIAVFIPNWAQRIAATYPPGPEPIIATSKTLITKINLIFRNYECFLAQHNPSEWIFKILHFLF